MQIILNIPGTAQQRGKSSFLIVLELENSSLLW